MHKYKMRNIQINYVFYHNLGQCICNWSQGHDKMTKIVSLVLSPAYYDPIKYFLFSHFFLQALISVAIMFAIHWGYALANVCVYLIIYIYIGQANPGVKPGVADFQFFRWIKSLFQRLLRYAFISSSPSFFLFLSVLSLIH